MRIETARRFALSLPETTEEPHFDMSSFRVHGKIFATMPREPGILHVFVDEAESRSLAVSNPEAYSELWWGKRLSGLRVDLRRAERREVCELLELAWRRKAPKKLLR